MNSRKILDGAALIAALGNTREQVRWLRPAAEGGEVMISPAMAIPIVRAGDYEGRTNRGHVLFIREITRAPIERDASFWDDRGVRHFFGDQRSRPGEYFRSRRDGRLLWGRGQDWPYDHPEGMLHVRQIARPQG